MTNNGVLGKTDVKARVFEKGTITVDMFGFVFYRNFKYKIVTHARVFSLKPKFEISERQGLFLANALHFLNKKFGYENMCSWEKIKLEKIQLPTKNNEIDFNFMESFIAELEAERIAELSAYLKVSGFDNYELSSDEEKALQDFMNNKIEYGEFSYSKIFDNIKQGRRLKKEDQIPGGIPFVMAGTTNTGLVNYISNPVAAFPENSITIDIFGNTFYRNYSFGAGDDTGVYWNSKIEYSKGIMLFFASAMEKSIKGKFSYGKKLRSSQSYNFKMILPITQGKIDFDFIEKFICAIQKLVIKDVVMYADQKIKITKDIVKKQ